MEKSTKRPSAKLSTDDARQGETGRNVRYILAFGMVGAIVVVGLVYLTYLR